jgi:hypothetical protein
MVHVTGEPQLRLFLWLLDVGAKSCERRSGEGTSPGIANPRSAAIRLKECLTTGDLPR